MFLPEINKVQVVRLYGPDTIYFIYKGPSPFPNLNQNPYLKLECQRGYAEELLKQMGFFDFELINQEGSFWVEL